MKTITINWKIVLPYIIIIALGIVLLMYQNRSVKLKDDYTSQVKLTKALLDTITHYRNSRNELVNEKLTLQANVKDLEKINNYLTESQKELLARIKEVEKSNKLIAAALIKTNVILDSLRKGNMSVDSTEGEITVWDSLPDIQYKFKISKVVPKFNDQEPVFKINYLHLPNTQFIEFHWKNDKKEGFPVTFSVSNSNKYFQTSNIESYAIPELQKEELKPNFWQKIKKGFQKTSPFFIGGVIGAVGILYLVK